VTAKTFRVLAVTSGLSPVKQGICIRIRDSIQGMRTIGSEFNLVEIDSRES